MTETICDLEYAVGTVERCPGDACPFWDDDECLIAGLHADLADSPELAELLLDLRTRFSPPDGWELVRRSARWASTAR